MIHGRSPHRQAGPRTDACMRGSRIGSTGSLESPTCPFSDLSAPCDMAAIHALSLQYGFNIIEDASHAIGGRYKNEPIGSCRYSDITIFSFHPVKIITTGEGGMALTNNQDVADKMRRLSSHGTTREADLMTHKPDGPWYYQQIELGYNYRITDIQAALGLSQMKRLDDLVAKKFWFFPAKQMLWNRLRVADWIADYRGPLFVAHGGRDKLVPFAHGERLFHSCPSAEKTFVRQSNATHFDCANQRFYRELHRFLLQLAPAS